MKPLPLLLLLPSLAEAEFHLGSICLEATHQSNIDYDVRESCDHVRHAVALINNHSDGVLDDVLVGHQIILHEDHPTRVAGIAAEPCVPAELRATLLPPVYAAINASAGGLLSGVIGGSCSGDLVEIADARPPSQQTVLFAGASTASSPFDNLTAYPNIVRPLSNEARRARAFAAVADRYSWRRVGVVYDGSIWGSDSRDKFTSAYTGVVAAEVLLPRPICEGLNDTQYTAPEFESALDTLSNAGVTIVFAALLPKCARILLGTSYRRSREGGLAAARSMHGPGYAWILSWLSDSMIFLDDSVTQDLDALYGAEGSLGIQEAVNTSSARALFSSYRSTWLHASSRAACTAESIHAQEMYCDLDEDPLDIFSTTYHAIWADAVFTFATALHRLLAAGPLAHPPGTGAFADALFATASSMAPFEGVSGTVAIGADGDRIGTLEVKNMQVTNYNARGGDRPTRASGSGAGRRELAVPITSLLLSFVDVGIVEFGGASGDQALVTIDDTAVLFPGFTSVIPTDAFPPPPPTPPPSKPPLPPPSLPPYPSQSSDGDLFSPLAVVGFLALAVSFLLACVLIVRFAVRWRRRWRRRSLNHLAIDKAHEEGERAARTPTPGGVEAEGEGRCLFYFMSAARLIEMDEMPSFRELQRRDTELGKEVKHGRTFLTRMASSLDNNIKSLVPHYPRGASASRLGKQVPYLVPLMISPEAVYDRRYADAILTVSHRWETSGSPDPQKKQFAELKKHLKQRPAIQYVWVHTVRRIEPMASPAVACCSCCCLLVLA